MASVPFPAAMTEAEPEVSGFSIANQKVELDLNFSASFKGRTQITIHPESKDLRIIRLNARQLHITRVTLGTLNDRDTSKSAKTSRTGVKDVQCAFTHEDPYDQLTLHAAGSVNQHHIVSQKLRKAIQVPPAKELTITVPKRLQIKEENVTEIHTQNATIKISAAEGGTAAATQALPDASVSKFTPLVLCIEYTSKEIRDGVHFVTGRLGNGRWPHAYTKSKLSPGSASCIFPCLDSLNARCNWEISLTCPTTVKEAIRQARPEQTLSTLELNDESTPASRQDGLEMVILCSGDMVDEVVDKNDATKKTITFAVEQQRLSAPQIGFAVGPFERVKISEQRFAVDVEALGQNLVEINGYCLPQRSAEMKTTCLPLVDAVDYMVRKYTACPSKTHDMCFVEDLSSETSTFAGMSICSTKLLYPEDVLDPAQDVTRELVNTIVSQWIGVDLIPERPQDTWVIVACARFITDLFMKELCGNNEYRYRMKQQSELVLELDHDRPSLYDMGALLHVDPSEYDFMTKKAPLILFILDRRIAKTAGRSKMPGIIAKMLTRARIGDLENNAISTEAFQKTCESFYHNKIDDFLNQWVKGAGCPRFQANQRFNKKKLVVEMVVTQIQANPTTQKDLEPCNFMRDVREDFNEVYAAPPQAVFTGPMTIRIHEADGTPYEHIVEIKDVKTSFEIPYNTKYKRLKRSKRQKSKHTAAAELEGGEGENDALLYCLGDVLQGEDDKEKWRLTEWSADDEEHMGAESYEWIRLDADFEWICRIQILMPGYMFVSQLQQDRDVVAQIESINQMSAYPAHVLVSSFFLKTVMDKRYFHGVRTAAAHGLAKHAKPGDINWIGLFHLRKAFEELFCVSEHDSRMARPNDFSNPQSYYVQCAIIEAMAEIRDEEGVAPNEVKEFLLDKLRFNDNSINEFSDVHYVSKLMRALCKTVTAKSKQPPNLDAMELDEATAHQISKRLEAETISEIDRYRRMDEWTDSYQNLYSRTALECQYLLGRAGICKHNPMHFLQYTRPGNYDMLRMTAYRILTQPEIFENPSVLKYVSHCMVADSSPWIRTHIVEGVGNALAQVAIGVHKDLAAPTQDGLVIEDPAAQEARKQELARRQTLDGAIEALCKELRENEVLKRCLWDAINYPSIGLEDLQALLEFCRLLYEEIDEMKVTLKYPRFWEVENLGNGRIRFRQSGKVRTKPISKAPAPQPQQSQYNVLPPPLQTRPVPLKLTIKKQSSPASRASPVVTPPILPMPMPTESSAAPAMPEKKEKLKLKLNLKPRPEGGH